MDIWSTSDGHLNGDEAGGETDTERLLHDSTQINEPNGHAASPDCEAPVLYKRRWYILALFSLNAFNVGLVWNTWGPISRSATAVFGWTNADFSLLSNWGPITYLIVTPIFVWLMDVKGMRWATVITSAFIAAGAGIRCIPTNNTTVATWLMHTGQFLNGIAGPVGMGGSPVLSAAWFPVNERVTATAIAAGFNAFGSAVAFIIGPAVVPDSHNVDTGQHRISDTFGTPIAAKNISIDDVNSSTAEIHAGIMRLMYIEFGWTAFLLLLTIIYFPSRPPTPPSVSASQERVDYKKGLKTLIRKPMVWVLALIYAIPGGVYGGFQSILEVILKEKGIPQNLGGWVGFYSSIAGSLVGLLIGRFADRFKRQMKLYLMLFYTGSAASAYVFAIAYEGYIPFTKEVLYASNIGLGLFITAGIPLIFELGCEMAYPVAEGLTNGFMTWLNNLAGLVFLLILMAPNIGTGWVTWFVLGSNAVGLPCLLLLREHYGRLNVDTPIATAATTTPIEGLNAADAQLE